MGDPLQSNEKRKVDFEGATLNVTNAGILDTTATPIDPATKQKQQEQIDQVGEVQDVPTQYTVLDRLKAIKTAIDTAAGGTTNADVVAAITAFQGEFTSEDFAQEGTLLDLLACCGDVVSGIADLDALLVSTNAALQSIDDELVLINGELGDQTTELEGINQKLSDVTTTEDATSVDAQKGIPAMAVANEAQTDLVSDDGNETRLATDKKGNQLVRDALVAAAVSAGSQYAQWKHLKELDAVPNEQIKRDAGPLTVYSYHGRAARAALDGDAVWEVMRLEFLTVGKVELVAILMNEGIAWDDRITGGAATWA